MTESSLLTSGTLASLLDRQSALPSWHVHTSRQDVVLEEDEDDEEEELGPHRVEASRWAFQVAAAAAAAALPSDRRPRLKLPEEEAAEAARAQLKATTISWRRAAAAEDVILGDFVTDDRMAALHHAPHVNVCVCVWVWVWVGVWVCERRRPSPLVGDLHAAAGSNFLSSSSSIAPLLYHGRRRSCVCVTVLAAISRPCRRQLPSRVVVEKTQPAGHMVFGLLEKIPGRLNRRDASFSRLKQNNFGLAHLVNLANLF